MKHKMLIFLVPVPYRGVFDSVMLEQLLRCEGMFKNGIFNCVSYTDMLFLFGCFDPPFLVFTSFLGAFDSHFFLVSTGNRTCGGLLHDLAFEAVSLTACLLCHPLDPSFCPIKFFGCDWGSNPGGLQLHSFWMPYLTFSVKLLSK